jgi:excisionase family DNA binding protein
MYSRLEAADFLRISLRTFDKLLASGQIAPRRIGRRVLIPRDELERLMSSGDGKITPNRAGV